MADRLTDLIFDADFYASVSGATGSPRELRRHFDRHGRAAGLAPGPLFDPEWYLARNRDIVACGVTPYDHFLRWGCAEGRAPNPLFDPAWYKRRYGVRGDALRHYMRQGRHEGLRPNPFFDTAWYALRYTGGDTEPSLSHYISEGWRQGAWPGPLFDPGHYSRTHAAHLAGAADPLAHFIGRVNTCPDLSPHLLFDGAFFLSGLERSGRADGRAAFEIYVEAGLDDGLPDPHPLFDAAFYRAARGAECGPLALIDYADQGWSARIDPNPYFSKHHYYAHAPDVVNCKVDALEHYLASGDAEGRAFHPLFDPVHYRAQGPVEGTCLGDYLARGRARGRTLRPPEPADTLCVQSSPLRALTRVSRDRVEAVRDPGERIGIFAHIFHLDCAAEMMDAANNAPRGPTRLFVSTDTATKAAAIRKLAERISNHPVEVRVIENRGRDIAPFLVGFADRLGQVEIACHIHSKRSMHYEGAFDGWRRYLIDQCLGSPELVANILGLLAQPGVGAYAPEHFQPVRDLLQWGGNFAMAETLMQMMGERITRAGPLEFPSGSMFWARTEALRPLLDLDLRTGHFEPEAGQGDGTLAHAIERIFLMVVESAGFGFVTGSAVAGPGSRIEVNRLRPMRSDLGPAVAWLPHAAGYLVRASAVARPRLNLLIPTIDLSRTYAGVATAVEVFGALRERLGPGFDARIVTTDADVAPNQPLADGIERTALDAADRASLDTIVPGIARHSSPMAVRDNDIFLATAWWTAHQGFGLMDAQDRIFGTRTRQLVYLIQDHENGFYPWSTEWALADSTYRQPGRTIPVFNTPILAEFFRKKGLYDRGEVLLPAINRRFAGAIGHGRAKEKLVLLYARNQAARNCLPFLDMVVAEARRRAPGFWSGWRFLAIGEDLQPGTLKSGAGLEVLGRLSLDDYAQLASRAALGVSLMISPHPSYPPLEMAAAGVRVLANRHGARDSADLHENIETFGVFDPEAVAVRLREMAEGFLLAPDAGWAARPKIDWFFDGGTNLEDVTGAIARRLGGLVASAGDRASPAPYLSVA